MKRSANARLCISWCSNIFCIGISGTTKINQAKHKIPLLKILDIRTCPKLGSVYWGLIDPSAGLAHNKTGIPKQSADEGPAHGGRVRPNSYFIPVDFTKSNVS
ncbi:hypothetical protein Niako_2306 [Niastella koreensis GR20-10]|uniref:Uncharacterized protein n=1 Tax=Niastella koreensis (strain DSM 17620 / KACC 11465 / NBRC 106392 / GR20-10) TaxID=700598 RepID=G8TJB8_NIAKG|nr:hypothetical protein Niako_2306 [Niastella koreensis GR20-10]